MFVNIFVVVQVSVVPAIIKHFVLFKIKFN